MAESRSTSARARRPRPIKVEPFLRSFAKKLSTAQSLRNGSISFRLTGGDADEYCLDCSKGSVQPVKGLPQTAPLIEVMGDARRIQAILRGSKDGRTQFAVGGIRIRGDLRYLSDLALELGIIEEPL